MSDKKELKVKKNEVECGLIYPLEFHLTDHCNLGCKYCSHYSPVAEPRFASMEEVRSAAAAVRVIKPKKLRLLGGEPLLHPNIDEIIRFFGENISEKTDIYLITNGTLIKNMSDEFWELIKAHNITVYISIYPTKHDYNRMIETAREKGIALSGIYNPRLKFFAINRSEDKRYDPENEYSKCETKCMQIRDEKLYPCPYSAYIEHINKRYGTEFIHMEGDYYKISEITDVNDVKEWMEIPKPFCAHCNYTGRTKVRWESTAKHEIEEWIEK